MRKQRQGAPIVLHIRQILPEGLRLQRLRDRSVYVLAVLLEHHVQYALTPRGGREAVGPLDETVDAALIAAQVRYQAGIGRRRHAGHGPAVLLLLIVTVRTAS